MEKACASCKSGTGRHEMSTATDAELADCAPTIMDFHACVTRQVVLGPALCGETAGILTATRLLSECPSSVVSGHGVLSRSVTFMHDGTAEWHGGARTEASKRSGHAGFV